MIYTIGFTQKSAETFFETIKSNNIQAVIDVRLNNKSQLAGFAKGRDLEYFLKEICGSQYFYEPQFAPSKELLDKWHKKEISWDEYTEEYIKTISMRKAERIFDVRYSSLENVCLLCTEPTIENCHRRLLAEYLVEKSDSIKGSEVKHI